MVKFSEKKIVAGSIVVLGVLFAIIAALTDCSAGGADNYAHFNIARWAFRYPHLFFDHWGKPLYTVLVAPFDQIGFYGARLFNITVGLFTAWICYLLALELKMQKAWLVPVFVIFAPMYFVLMFSGMTEILFSAVLALAILLFFREKYILSAIAISFIIMVRSEGVIFLPLFLLGFLLKRKYWAIPFLAFGFVVFSLIGWLYHYHNFWWLVTNLPYVGGVGGIYGSGPWYHFLTKMPEFLDYFILVFFLAGMIVWIKNWQNSPRKLTSEWFFILLLVAGCFWIYLAAHSYVWWKGEMSLGLIRVMAGVSPLAGIIALAGWNEADKLIWNNRIRRTFLCVSILLVVLPGTLRYKSAFKTDSRYVLINEVVGWIQSTGDFRHRLIVHDPFIAFAAQVDAWDQQRLQYGFSDVNAPENSMPDSSIFIWDAHFSQNEGRVPAALILNNPYYELIGYFEPEIPFKVLNGYDYNIMVFRKVSERKRDNRSVLEELKTKVKEPKLIFSEFYDFEHPVPEKIPDQFVVHESDSLSNKCYLLGKDSEFSPSVLLTDSKVNISNQLSIGVEFDFISENQLGKNEVLMVFSVEKDDKPYFYDGKDVLSFVADSGIWNHAKFLFYMPEEVKKETKVKLYIWDVQKKSLKIDNFRIQVYSK